MKKRRKSRRLWMTRLYESRTWLINLIQPTIAKRDTSFRKAIPVTERLALTLRFLASGDSYTSLQHVFKISKQAISTVIPEVCSALIE
ncbi:hypothetical protein PR048_008247 [Dryococelus australis]|uniref:Transposase n=1 Tax=Dryococelus australis TaxID=614101 RepID=A0ABQ9HWN5_9NEOP|nr:hypothetical protein PR048_008247 [Dryococelus australis]